MDGQPPEQPPRDRVGPIPPVVRLGAIHDDGIAPSIYALVLRGVARNPGMARTTLGLVELRFAEAFEPTRIAFRVEEIIVEDGAWDRPDLVISGRLPDIVALTTAPLYRGVPNPRHRYGRRALARVTGGRVRVRGNKALGRRLLQLLQIEPPHAAERPVRRRAS
jgi:hypothetical protein